MPKAALGQGSPIPVTILASNEALIAHFSEALLEEFRAARTMGREKIVFIVPVGPVGQFERVARRCNTDRISLRDLVLVNMDEYLTPDGASWISPSDPLSFRRHMDECFYKLLDPALAPPEDQRVFPDPRDVTAVPQALARWGEPTCASAASALPGTWRSTIHPSQGNRSRWRSFASDRHESSG